VCVCVLKIIINLKAVDSVSCVAQTARILCLQELYLSNMLCCVTDCAGHVWPVTVQMPSAAVAETTKDAANSSVVPSGDYRLCMSASNISLQPCTDGRKEIVIPVRIAFTYCI